MKKIILIIAITILMITAGCDYNPITLPEQDQSAGIGISSGEIKYLQLNPVWSMANGVELNDPRDIFISLDDYIYVADYGNDRVIVMNKSGESVESDGFGNNFSALAEISKYGVPGEIISPRSVAVDAKLNVFITDSSNVIYCWNQYHNSIRNLSDSSDDSIATSVTYYNPATGEEVEITDFSYSYFLEAQGYNIIRVNYRFDSAFVDSILAPHPFYIDNSNENPSIFKSVAAAPSEQNAIYATDENNQRIIQIRMRRTGYIKFSNGVTLWLHSGQFERNVASSGLGAGTVNQPTGIFSDDGNNIFYTQTGLEFGFHKIKYVSGDIDLWMSAFTLHANEILDLGRFENAQDVTVENGNIFVLNSGENELQEFDFKGKFIRKAGLREVKVDTTVIDTNIVNEEFVYTERDTIISLYYNDLLDNPKGVDVDDGVIYILNSGKNEIIRFGLSDDIDIDPDDLN